MIGFEALIRWQHPQRGEVSPAVFIPVAEDSGAILQIGEWVLATACEEAARWKNPLTVAVNVSAVQLHNPNFSRKVHEVLLRSGLAPGRLELEITETALVKDMPRALATLRQVKALGVRVAMDDFGPAIPRFPTFAPSPLTRSRSTAPSSNPSTGTARSLRSFAPCWDWVAALACLSWPRASRHWASCASSTPRTARSDKAFILAGRARSRRSAN
ncbi:hypothetical protein AJ88_44290 [Mesorhizobium amorphae CCBAU 01583]|nr:hypothetical protein AJ88_44290 [Mesorhizobium amorphae CCBAU 01583]